MHQNFQVDGRFGGCYKVNPSHFQEHHHQRRVLNESTNNKSIFPNTTVPEKESYPMKCTNGLEGAPQVVVERWLHAIVNLFQLLIPFL